VRWRAWLVVALDVVGVVAIVTAVAIWNPLVGLGVAGALALALAFALDRPRGNP